jgi:hypothetical protein
LPVRHLNSLGILPILMVPSILLSCKVNKQTSEYRLHQSLGNQAHRLKFIKLHTTDVNMQSCTS